MLYFVYFSHFLNILWLSERQTKAYIVQFKAYPNVHSVNG